VRSLTGFTIGITGHRRATEQAEMLAKRGAEVLLGPVMRTVPLDDVDATIDATSALVSAPVDVIVLTTGVGTRSWLGVAESAGIDAELRRRAAEARVLARGPKARSAAIAGGLNVSWQAPGETAAEIVEHLRRLGVVGRRIGLQLDGGVDGPGSLTAAVRALGADVVAVPVYRWQFPDDVQPARRLLAAVTAGRIDAVTFTSAVAVGNMFELAADEGALVGAFAGPATAVAVGPVTARVLREHGVERVVEPERARLGAMVQAVVAELSGRRRVIAYRGYTATWQGSALAVEPPAGDGDDEPALLTSGESRLLATLLERAPAVVPKAALVDHGIDVHAAEVAVARLRTKLGPLGAGIRTVPRRGYRCELTVRAC
jgi:uroporphyrinogen-III synthase